MSIFMMMMRLTLVSINFMTIIHDEVENDDVYDDAVHDHYSYSSV